MNRIDRVLKAYEDSKNALDIYRKSVESVNKRLNPEFVDKNLLERLMDGTPKNALERALGTTHENLNLPWED